MSKFDLTDRVAIVTGGGVGIGRAIALEFARMGAHVVVASRKLPNLEKTAGEIKSLGRCSLAITTDVRVPEQVDNMVNQTMDEFGQIDILVNNAGASFVCPVEKLSPNGWDTIVAINLNGTFLCSVAVGKVMIQQKRGKIINLSSIVGLEGAPGMAPYGAAKAGIINFTKSLAVEWAKYNIYVNAIAPGLIETEGGKTQMQLTPEMERKNIERVPLRRYGQTQEIADAAIFLASDASSFLTGETIVVRGGPNPLLSLV
jgi:NAD(P)-dependent dehydrogenase (short-subunit alcohol dehydrogenase family)